MSPYSILVGACFGVALIFYVGIIWLSVIKTFLKNKKLDGDDPLKRKYSFRQVLLAPFLFPLVFLSRIVILTLEAILALIFLPFFALLLVFARKWPESRLGKLLNWLGEYILGNSLWMFLSPAPQKR